MATRLEPSATLVFTVGLLLSAACHADEDRSAKWAQPVTVEGVPNLHRVNDQLYRSAQPTAEGMQKLEAMGIKTVINLRSFHTNRKELRGTDLKRVHITMKAWHPERKELIRFLRIVTDAKQTPVLVHCQHGADRTGLMTAVYRVVVQGWTKQEAIDEMVQGGYGFHVVWQNLPKYLRDLDVEDLRKRTGIMPPKKK